MRAFRRTAVLAWLIPAALLAGLLVPEAVKASRSEGESRAEGSVLSAAETPDEAAAEEERRIRGEAERMLAEMTLEEKVAQLFFVTPEALTGVSPVTVTVGPKNRLGTGNTSASAQGGAASRTMSRI